MQGAKREPGNLPVIGWREWAALPELGVSAVKAKIDTGARSSALHAFDLETFERDSRPMVRFVIHPHQHSDRNEVVVEAEIFEYRKVTSSSGHQSVRPVIVTEVEVHGRRFKIELTLTNRDTLGFRMLLGRQAICEQFTVDPAFSFLGGRRKDRARLQMRKRKRGEKRSQP